MIRIQRDPPRPLTLMYNRVNSWPLDIPAFNTMAERVVRKVPTERMPVFSVMRILFPPAS